MKRAGVLCRFRAVARGLRVALGAPVPHVRAWPGSFAWMRTCVLLHSGVGACSRLTSLLPLHHPHVRPQVCTELENHVGVGDKTLAEFIINLADENEGLPAFQRALESNGAEFPDSFVVTLHGASLRLLIAPPDLVLPACAALAGLAPFYSHPCVSSLPLSRRGCVRVWPSYRHPRAADACPHLRATQRHSRLLSQH